MGTNAALGRAGSANLPRKRNTSGLAGLGALTGKANFDLAEAVLRRLMRVFGDVQEVHYALLVKRADALRMAADLLGVPNLCAISFHALDARVDFGVAVDAGLLSFGSPRRRPRAASSSCLLLRRLRHHPIVSPGA